MEVFISPHPDDAILSAGGKLIQSQDPQLVINVFAKDYNGLTEWDKKCGFDKNPMQQRKKEDKEILNQLDVEVFNLDFLDKAVYEDIFQKKRNQSEIQAKIQNKLENILETLNVNNLYFPFGLVHSDHKILSRIGENLARDFKVYFYEDVPYVLNNDISPASHLEITQYDISDVISEKLDYIFLYTTQIQGFLHLTDINSKSQFRKALKTHHQKNQKYFERYRNLQDR